MSNKYKKSIKNVALFLICIHLIFCIVYGAILVIFFESHFFSLFFVFYGGTSYIIDVVRLFKELKDD
jgi:hypothetical protein